MSWEQIQQIITLLTAFLMFGGSIWALAWWLSGRFSKVYDKIDGVKDVLLEKLEYHEHHDDKRFNNITDELVAIKIRNAYKDGLPVIK